MACLSFSYTQCQIIGGQQCHCFVFLFSIPRWEQPDDTVVTIRHVEPDPNKEGVGVLVSVEDQKGNPKSFCSEEECNDAFDFDRFWKELACPRSHFVYRL